MLAALLVASSPVQRLVLPVMQMPLPLRGAEARAAARAARAQGGDLAAPTNAAPTNIYGI